MVDRKLLGERGSSGPVVFKKIGSVPAAALVCACESADGKAPRGPNHFIVSVTDKALRDSLRAALKPGDRICLETEVAYTGGGRYDYVLRSWRPAL
jgi:hypothetical protein